MSPLSRDFGISRHEPTGTASAPALAGAIGVALLALAGPLSSEAFAQTPQPNRIRIEYVPPKNPAHQPIYEQVTKARALEQIQEIFSPFRFPIDLNLKIVGCDGVDNAWYQRPAMTICYEYIENSVLKNVPKETTAAGITPHDAVVGQFFYVVAHELGHAVFDLLNVPLFGRPEDAADQFAAYMMLKVGKAEARRLIGGAAYTYQMYARNPKVTVPITAFAEAHGPPMSRLYNILCIAYGADRELFADLVTDGYLPEARARGCRVEYGEVNFAFQNLIRPHLDPALLKQVLSKSWLPDASAPPPRETDLVGTAK